MPRVNGNSKQEIFKQISFGIWSCARHRHFFEAPSRSSNHWIINQQISTVFVTQGQPNFQISALHCEANQNKAKNCALATVSVFRSSLDRYRLGCSGKGECYKYTLPTTTWEEIVSGRTDALIMHLYGRIISSLAKVVEPRHMRTSSECSSLGRTHRNSYAVFACPFRRGSVALIRHDGSNITSCQTRGIFKRFFWHKNTFFRTSCQIFYLKKLRWRLDKDLLLDIWWRMKMKLHPSYPNRSVFNWETHRFTSAMMCGGVCGGTSGGRFSTKILPVAFLEKPWSIESTGNSSDFGLEKCKSFVFQHELKTHVPHSWDNMVWKQQSESKLSISATPRLNMLFWT